MSFVDFFDDAQLQNFLRPALSQKLDEAIQSQNWSQASVLLSAFIDTWPLGGSIQQVWQMWSRECDPRALTFLHRANEVITLIGGAPLDIPITQALPPYESLLGEELADRRAELAQKALNGEIWAIECTTPVPLDAASQLALGELRMEACAQHAFEKYGKVGLLAPQAPSWEEALGRAPAGKEGENLRLLCDLALLPSTPQKLSRGECSATAWLLWNGPAQPLPIHPGVYQLLKNIKNGKAAAFSQVGLSASQGEAMVSELIALGALGHVG